MSRAKVGHVVAARFPRGIPAFRWPAATPFIKFVSIIGSTETLGVMASETFGRMNGDAQMNILRFHRNSGVRPVRSSSMLLILAACVALTLVACGDKEEAAPATVPSTAAGTSVAAGGSAEVLPGTTDSPVMPASVQQLLTNASAAYSEDRLVTPAGDNAIEYYLAVLGQEKDNIQATQGLVDLFPLGVSIAEKEISARNVEESTRIVNLLDESSPGSYTVQKLKSRLAALQNLLQREEDRRLAAEQAQAAAQARAQAEPAPAVAAPEPAPVAAARDTRPVAATEPVRATPPTPAPVPKPVGETRDAKVVRQVQPGYPQLAYRRRLAGWVELRFTVGTDGRVVDTEVIRADPPRMFDREATRAVEQWLFEPAMRDGVPVQSTLSRRIEFKYPG